VQAISLPTHLGSRGVSTRVDKSYSERDRSLRLIRGPGSRKLRPDAMGQELLGAELEAVHYSNEAHSESGSAEAKRKSSPSNRGVLRAQLSSALM
jgi:hypothetical protein